MIARARIAPAAATAFVDAAAETFALRYARNAHVADRTSQLPATSACVGVSANAEASTELSSWPGFAPSPVVSLPDLANAAGVASVVLKCEGGRFGIGSFKALGAPYAVAKLMKDDARPRTLSTASDGNHGVALAWAAKRHGCVAKIYLHHGVSAARAAAVERLGAEVVRAGDTYSCRVDMPQTGRGDAAGCHVDIPWRPARASGTTSPWQCAERTRRNSAGTSSRTRRGRDMRTCLRTF